MKSRTNYLAPKNNFPSLYYILQDEETNCAELFLIKEFLGYDSLELDIYKLRKLIISLFETRYIEAKHNAEFKDINYISDFFSNIYNQKINLEDQDEVINIINDLGKNKQLASYFYIYISYFDRGP